MSNDCQEVYMTCSLLSLPTELHQLIVKQLPLSSRLIYQYQVCSSLRHLLSKFNLLSYSHRFDLVEWRTAKSELKDLLQRQKADCIGQNSRVIGDLEAQEVKRNESKQSIWDISPSSTPRPAPTKPSTTLASGLSPLFSLESAEFQSRTAGVPADANGRHNLIYDDHPDVSLFVQALKLLRDNGQGQMGEEKLSVLSLLSRSGFKVASLIHLLETDPKLCNVETVLMTSANFIDSVLWTVFTPQKARNANVLLRSRQSTHSDLRFTHSTCIDTQAIVIPGPRSNKGQGLRSGFKCLCFSNFQLGQDAGSSSVYTPFHVIFHDWYNEEEAMSTQDMLENSEITCNTCKQIILF